jgi:hypothetical protein
MLEVKKVPPPQPAPEYSITGLTEQQFDLLRELVRIADGGAAANELHNEMYQKRGLHAPQVDIFFQGGRVGANGLQVKYK